VRCRNDQSVVVDREPDEEKGSTPPDRAYAVHCAGGRPAKMTCGLATVATAGTHSIREEYASRVSTSGLRLSASSVAAGRRILIRMRTDKIRRTLFP
jgi:hypothetical protein